MLSAHQIRRIPRTIPLVLFVGCGTSDLAPIAPRPLANSLATTILPALPPLPPSVVDAPISYALAPALDALERAVPRTFGDIEHRIVIPGNTRQQVAFFAKRTPFSVAFDGHRITLATTVTYQGRGWYKPPVAPMISASCGTTGDAPRLRVILTTDVDITKQWVLATRTKVRSITPVTSTARDECRVTMFKIDVTDRVVKALEPQLNEQLPPLDRRIAAFDIHTRIERWYNLLNKSIHMRDSLWLVLAPEGVKLGDLSLRDSALVADVRLTARPFLVSGPRPPRPFTPLPPFTKTDRAVGDSARFRLEGLLAYDDASATLTQKLGGLKIKRFGQSIQIAKVRVYAIGDGRVVFDVGVKGDIVGDAYFVGTPKLDTLTRTLTVPDLDFDVATSNALVRGLAWLKKADMVTDLRKRARLPLDPPLEELRSRAEQVLDRELTEGVRLKGKINTGRLIDVVAQTRWLVVRAEASGSLGLRIDREIEFGKPARNKAQPKSQ